MKGLKEVNWRKKYPLEIRGGEMLLKRKNWGFRLIYDVYLKEKEGYRLIGPCHVFEKTESESRVVFPCEEPGSGFCPRRMRGLGSCSNDKFVVKELVNSPEVVKRLEDIQILIRKSL